MTRKKGRRREQFIGEERFFTKLGVEIESPLAVDTPLSIKVGTNLAGKRTPLGEYSSLAD
jgi:hypothetical protein